MILSQKVKKSAGLDAPTSLVEALFCLWNRHSHAEISIRMIAREARVSVSAVDYHYGNLEHLFVATQDCALEQASAWMDGIFTDLSGFGESGIPADALAPIVAALIDDWTGAQRTLALAWREAHAACVANPGLASPHCEWNRLWRDFWQRFCTLSQGDLPAELLMLFFDGKAALHLVRSHGWLDRALLDETVSALFLLLRGDGPAPSPIREAHLMLAEAEYQRSFTESPKDAVLDETAANILAQDGLAALTFRTVASRAGSTLGAASYHFGSKSKMLRVALQRLYENSAGQSATELIDALPSTPEAVLDAVVEGISGGQVPVLRAIDEITLTLSRDGDHAALNGVIRNFRDPIAMTVLSRMLANPAHASPALAAVFASTTRGFGHYCAGMDAGERRELGRRALRPFLAS